MSNEYEGWEKVCKLVQTELDRYIDERLEQMAKERAEDEAWYEAFRQTLPL